MSDDLNELRDLSQTDSSVSGKVRGSPFSALVGCLGEEASVGGEEDLLEQENQESRKDQNKGPEGQGASGHPLKHMGGRQAEESRDKGVSDDLGKQREGEESDPESEECACRPCKKICTIVR